VYWGGRPSGNRQERVVCRFLKRGILVERSNRCVGRVKGARGNFEQIQQEKRKKNARIIQSRNKENPTPISLKAIRMRD